MFRSDPKSTLVLLAANAADAEHWQIDHPELADAVRVVTPSQVLWHRVLDGRVTMAAYYTDYVQNDPRFRDAHAILLRKVEAAPREHVMRVA